LNKFYLIACETLGYVNNICCEQTGIFTKNRMNVSSVFIEEVAYNCSKNMDFINKETLQLLCEWSFFFNLLKLLSKYINYHEISICINSIAVPKFWGNGEAVHQGDEIECALLELAYKFGYNFEDYRPSSKVFNIFSNYFLFLNDFAYFIIKDQKSIFLYK